MYVCIRAFISLPQGDLYEALGLDPSSDEFQAVKREMERLAADHSVEVHAPSLIKSTFYPSALINYVETLLEDVEPLQLIPRNAGVRAVRAIKRGSHAKHSASASSF